MCRKIAVVLSLCLMMGGTSIAQTKKPVAKPKPKTTTKTTKTTKPTTVTTPAVAEPTVCYPMKKVKDYYKIDIRDEQFKGDFEEIFELSPYDYSGYSLKTIIENTIRMKLGDAQANSLDMFAGASYLEIGFMKQDYKKQILDEICTLFADHNAFEKYIKTLKKKSKEETKDWRL